MKGNPGLSLTLGFPTCWALKRNSLYTNILTHLSCSHRSGISSWFNIMSCQVFPPTPGRRWRLFPVLTSHQFFIEAIVTWSGVSLRHLKSGDQALYTVGCPVLLPEAGAPKIPWKEVNESIRKRMQYMQNGTQNEKATAKATAHKCTTWGGQHQEP